MRRAASSSVISSSSSSTTTTTATALAAARLVSRTRSATAQGNFGPSEASSRDAKRYKEFHDFHTGERQQMFEPDTAPTMQFRHGSKSHVTFDKNKAEKGKLTDWEKQERLAARFGPEGPGEKLKKSVAQMKRDELQKQQDVDGLPWEVRWKKALIPTQEEVVQDMRDRFENWYEDPLVREQEWFLHWTDRIFKAQPDRRIWPQGFTDYLDQYDGETGRRKFLPGDAASRSALLDSNAQKRLWMADAEERKTTMLLATTSQKAVEEESDAKMMEHLELAKGLEYGVIDMDPDAAVHALQGTADPVETARTAHKLNSYAATQTWKAVSGQEPGEIDPVSGMPKSTYVDKDGKLDTMLPSGITVEQAALLEAKSQMYEEEANQRAESAIMAGDSGVVAGMSEHMRRAKESGEDRPFQQTSIEGSVAKVRRANQQLAASENQTDGYIDVDAPPRTNFADIEKKLLAEQKQRELAAADPDRPAERFMDPAEIVCGDGDDAQQGSRGGRAHPQWYTEDLVETEPLIESYGLTGDPLEQKQLDEETLRRYRTKPDYDPRRLRRWDATTQGESAFDGAVAHRERTQDPKLAHGAKLKRLPKYSELSGGGAAAASAAESSTTAEAATKDFEEDDSEMDLRDDPSLPKSERLRRRRILRLREKHQQRKQVAVIGEESSSNKNNLPASTAPSSSSSNEAFHPDVLLPDLPWEGDTVLDPNRGLAKKGLKFDRELVTRAFRAYRECLTAVVAEMNQMNGTVVESEVEAFLRERVNYVRSGEVLVAAKDFVDGDVGPEVEELLRIIFEGHMLQVLSEYVSARASRKSEVEALRSQADDLMRKAAAKCKLLGKAFVDFMQELTTDELEQVKKTPYQRLAILVRDKKHLPVVKPFSNWMASDLTPLANAMTGDGGQEAGSGSGSLLDPTLLERRREIALKSLSQIRATLPLHTFTEIADNDTKTTLADGAYSWCRAALDFFTAKIYHELCLRHADTRFRSRGDELAEKARDEWSTQYYQCQRATGLTIPIPHSDPRHVIDDGEFLAGESGSKAEAAGNLMGAEAIYKQGVSFRWYGEIDETEYMYYLERRGLVTQAMEVSDRCLEAMNKKTHPSVFPFPSSAARPFLEGAPLTQETAEHLWLRMMGELHMEHADFNLRVGRNKTAAEQRQRGVGMIKMALAAVQEKKLPESWRAPLLTRAKLLCNNAVPPGKAREHLALLEQTLDEIVEVEDAVARAEKAASGVGEEEEEEDDETATAAAAAVAAASTSSSSSSSAQSLLGVRGKWATHHWIDHRFFCDIKAALVFHAHPLYHHVFMEDAAALIGHKGGAPSPAEAQQAQAGKVAGGSGQFSAEHDHIRRIVEAVGVTSGSYRRRMAALRDREPAKSDAWHVYNLLRFWVRVSPKTEEEVGELWAELEPTYDYFYTQAALGNRARSRFLGEVLRRMSFILLAPPATLRHKETLLEALTKVQERMHASVKKAELDKAVATLSAHVEGLKQTGGNKNVTAPYTFGDITVMRAGQRAQAVAGNPMLSGQEGMDFSALEGKQKGGVSYDALRKREMAARAGDVGDVPFKKQP